jgi:hypothetical protein
VTGLRQVALVVALGLASFGALFAVARASDDSDDAPARAAKPVAVPEAAQPASVNVASLGKAAPLPAMRSKPRKFSPAPAPVVEEPVTTTAEPTYSPPTYSPPPSPQSSDPPPPSNPGQSFDDSG